ncbi:hypothetical protein SCUCBS95973_005798 [Sporothrix curviconia]|uniref:CENP-T/Histone H4 histone fold domain-containing protein n=1 Tax=Sporothrix curviconia TaxID=1260050 RepID=A0ABP0C248_9PEZI
MSTPRGAFAGGAPIQTPTTGGRQQRPNAPSSAGGASTFRTPNTVTRTNAGGGRRTPGTAGRTPHARAARLALDSRRTAIFTPGGRQSRRKSGRMLRDSPRDLLRNLSRRLAPMSQAIASSSSPGSSGGSANRSRRSRRPLPDIGMDMDMDMVMNTDAIPEGSVYSASRRRTYRSMFDDDDDDSLPLDRPRMSLNIEEDDNDDDLRPHRSMILENGSDADVDAEADLANFTMRSVELARRAATQEQLLQARRFSRGSLGVRSSFGSMRMSDYIDEFGRGDGDNNAEDDLDRLQQQSAFFPEGAFDNLLPGAEDGTGVDLTFERLDSDTGEQGRDAALRAADGGESGLGVIDLGLDGGNETTFMLNTQQSPDRTLNPTLVDDDGPADMGDFDTGFDGGDDYGGNDNGGNFWDDDDDDEGNLPGDEGGVGDVGATADDTAANSKEKAAVLLRSGQENTTAARGPGKKRLKLSAHGIAYPSLPAGVVKRIAQTFASSGSSGAGKSKTKLSPETVAALSTASDWFFEQVGVDLQRYAKHAGRRTIDESDVMLLMRRQRQVNASVTAFSLAQRMMPRELLQELRMIPDAPALKRRQGQSKERISSVPKRIRKNAVEDGI